MNHKGLSLLFCACFFMLAFCTSYAAEGCGSGMHRNYRGVCVPNTGILTIGGFGIGTWGHRGYGYRGYGRSGYGVHTGGYHHHSSHHHSSHHHHSHHSHHSGHR